MKAEVAPQHREGAGAARARARERLTAALTIFAGLAVGAAAALLVRAGQRLGTDPSAALSSLAGALGVPVEADRLSVRYWPPAIVADGVTVPDLSPLGPGSLLRADALELRLSPWALLGGALVVDEVRLVRPVLRLVRGPAGRWNLPPAPAGRAVPGPIGPPGGPSVELDLQAVRVRAGRIRYRDRGVAGAGEMEVGELNLLARRTPARGLEVAFNAAVPGGGPGGIEGSVAVPPPDSPRELTLSTRLADTTPAAIEQALALLHAGVPFEWHVHGRPTVAVEGRLERRWPPASGRLTARIDLSGSSLEVARGWLGKPAAAPAALEVVARVTSSGLVVDRLGVESDGLRLVGRADSLARGVDLGEAGAAGETQAPIRFSVESASAGALAAWVPPLRGVAISGSVSLDGRLAPEPDGVAVDLAADGEALEARSRQGALVLLGGGKLRLSESDGSLRATASASGVRWHALSAARLRGSLEGRLGEPLEVQLGAEGLGRGAVRIEGLAAAGTLEPGRLELPWVDAGGLGGTLSGSASVAWSDRGLVARLEPRWERIDLGALLALAGAGPVASGAVSGRARLSLRPGIAGGLRPGPAGGFEALLEEGVIAGVDPLARVIEAVGSRPGRQRQRAGAPVRWLYASGQVAAGAVSIDTLEGEGPGYGIDASGVISLAGEVDLRGTVEVSTVPGLALDRLPSGLLARGGRAVRLPVALRGSYPDVEVSWRREGAEPSGLSSLLERLLEEVR